MVGVNDGAWLDGRLDRGEQGLGAEIGDAGESCTPHPDPALLDCDLDDRLLGGAAASLASGDTADIGLICLDLAREPVAIGPNHRPAQLVEQRPGRLIASHSEHPLQRERAHTVFRAGRIPRSLEPGRERQTRVGEDRPGRDRGVQPTAGAAEIPSLAHPPAPRLGAGRAGEAARPTKPSEVIQRCLLVAEARVELAQSSRVIAAGKRSIHPSSIARAYDGIATKGRQPDSPL